MIKKTSYIFFILIILVFWFSGNLKLPWKSKIKLAPPSTILAANQEDKFLVFLTSSGEKKVIAQRFQTLRPGFLKNINLRFYEKGLIEIRTGKNKPDMSKKGLIASSNVNNYRNKWTVVRFDKQPFLDSFSKYWIVIIKDISKNKEEEYYRENKPIAFKVFTERNLNAISLDRKATINFFPVKGAEYYNIYRSDNFKKSWKMVGSTTELGFTDKNLANGKKYFYSVTACAGFLESEKSRPVAVTPLKNKIPSLQWKQPLYSNNYGEFPLFYKGDKFIGAGSSVYRFEIKTGRLKKIYRLVNDSISLNKNFIVTGQGLIVKIKNQDCLIWAASCDSSTIKKMKTPVTAISALRLSDGKKIWSKFVKGRYIAEGLVSDKKKLYMTTISKSLFAFNLNTGKIKFITKINSANVPVIYGNYLYVGSSQTLNKINKQNGNVVSKLYLSDNSRAGFSSPIIVNDKYLGKKIIFTSLNSEIFLIDLKSFKKEWAFVSGYGISHGSLYGAGAYHNGRFYVSIRDSIFALDVTKKPTQKGFVIWEKKIKNKTGGSTYVSGAVTLTNNNLYGRGARLMPVTRKIKEIVVFALDPKTGEDRWILPFEGNSGFICSNPWPYIGLLSLDRAYSQDMRDPGFCDYAIKISNNTKMIDLLEYRGNKYHQGYVDLNL